jgi:hypothetical protein
MRLIKLSAGFSAVGLIALGFPGAGFAAESHAAKAKPTINRAQVRAVALRAALGARDPHPTTILAVSTTLGAATVAAQAASGAVPEPRPILPNEPVTPVQRVIPDSNLRVVMVSMTGHFRWLNVPIPRGKTAPSGTVLTLIFDPVTGDVKSGHLTNSAPKLSKLGTVLNLA